MQPEKLESVITRLEAVACKLESISTKTETSSSAIVEEFQPIISGPCAEFVQVCDKIGGEVKEAGALFKKAFDDTYELMKVVSTSKKPSPDALKDVLKPLADSIEEIKKYASKHFKSEFKTHLEALAGYASCFAWVQAPSKPQAYITENIDSGVFYANRVLSSFKDKGPEHKEFVQKLRACFEKLKEYAQEYHAIGITWNQQGTDAKTPQASSASTPAAKPEVKSTPKPAANPNALFSQLNQGASVTSKLKKVDDSQKTHKNPTLRASAVVSDTGPKSTSRPAQAQAQSTKPPRFELEGKKWVVENQIDQQMLEIKEGDLKNCVYMFNCTNTNLIVHNKLNVVTFDKCQGCKLQLVKGLISGLDITNSKKIDIQADDILPTANVNSSDQIQFYLNDETKEMKLVTNTSTSINICYHPKDKELIEYPVPEVFTHYIKGDKLVTEVSENI